MFLIILNAKRINSEKFGEKIKNVCHFLIIVKIKLSEFHSKRIVNKMYKHKII